MFKKDYYVQLREINLEIGQTKFEECVGVVRARNANEAVEKVRKQAKPIPKGYFVFNIHRI